MNDSEAVYTGLAGIISNITLVALHHLGIAMPLRIAIFMNFTKHWSRLGSWTRDL
jgi:hypothetical protein